MLYRVFHITKFTYSSPVTETVMELRMEPRTDERQRCHNFSLRIKPTAVPTRRFDHLGNCIHHFDIPGQHSLLELHTESVVETFPASFPEETPSKDVAHYWEDVDKLRFHPEFWEFTQEGEFTHPTDLLLEFTREFGFGREVSPLTFARSLNEWLYDTLSYDTEATTVDSSIDVAISNRKGVCQDFSNIMITMLRGQGIPARYISGYLFHRTDDRSHVAQDSTHAWVEAYIPGNGWIGFDPTNKIPAGERHIRVAIGRDYADVPPTRGVFKGVVESTLSVAVRVSLADDAEARLTPPAFVKGILAKTTEKKHVYRYDDQQQ